MTGANTAKKNRDPIFMVCLVIFAIAAITAIVCDSADSLFPSGDKTASTGDSVTVEYTGTYYAAYGQDNAVVFDTSIASIANDSNIEKSNDFTKKSSYSPLTFKVGDGTMLKGFENSVIGHKVGDTYSIYLTEYEGYVAPAEGGVLSFTGNVMPATKVVTTDEFESSYYSVKLSDSGVKIFQSKYKWDAQAMYVDEGKSVMITYMPKVGETYTVYDSNGTTVTFKVTSVGENVVFDINIENPVKIDGDKIKMIKLELEKTIYITAVSGNSIIYKLGSEKTNEPLYFEIKITKIE